MGNPTVLWAKFSFGEYFRLGSSVGKLLMYLLDSCNNVLYIISYYLSLHAPSTDINGYVQGGTSGMIDVACQLTRR